MDGMGYARVWIINNHDWYSRVFFTSELVYQSYMDTTVDGKHKSDKLTRW